MIGETFGWAFIGAGGIAHSVAKRITRGEHKIAAVWNRTRARAEELASKYGAKAFDSLEEAIACEEVNGVYINVTNNVHFDLCKKAIDCGKPILLEKPFTTDKSQTEELFERAKEKGVYIAEAMWTWYASPANEVKRVFDTGSLGKVKSGRITLCLPIALSKKNRILKSSLAGGALLDVGIYPITYAYRLFGLPKSMDCKARFLCDVDVTDDIIFHYDGFDIDIKTSVRSLCGVGEKLDIICENGSVKSGNYHSGGGAKVKTKDKTYKIAGVKNAMLDEFDRVSEEMKNGLKESVYVPHKSTADVMGLLDEVRSKIGLKFSFEK